MNTFAKGVIITNLIWLLMFLVIAFVNTLRAYDRGYKRNSESNKEFKKRREGKYERH